MNPSKATASITLGSKDSYTEEIGIFGESNAPSVVNMIKAKNNTPWVDLFKPNYDRDEDILHLDFFSPVNSGVVIKGLEANVPCQPNPPTLDNGEKETLSDASPNLELKDGDIALEGDKDLSKNLVHFETLSPHGKSSNLANVVSPFGTNTLRGKNILKEIIA
nr:hypothetical protein Iba_chr03cCG1010 [Ipomoea batatas]GMC75023.1 hypothetical protein Iba_chr03dCG1160 [Ipomoea batatas]